MKYYAWSDGIFIIANSLREARRKAYDWLVDDPSWEERDIPPFAKWCKGDGRDVVQLTKSERKDIYFQLGG